MKAKIDEGCIGCGQCVETCPEVFRMNDEDLAEVFADITVDTKDAAEDAVDSCPVGIISLED